MNKYLLLLGILLCLPLVHAGVVEKPLNISVANCYNITIHTNLIEGDEVDQSFTGCSKVDNNNFYCNCFNTNNDNFSVIMQTSDYPVHTLRNYKVEIDAITYSLKGKSMTATVEDAGDYYDLNRDDWRTMGIIYSPQLTPIYINNTVYKDRVEYVDRIVYQDKNTTVPVYINSTEYINVTQYVENTTRINKLKKIIAFDNILFLILGFLLICSTGYIVYTAWRKGI